MKKTNLLLKIITIITLISLLCSPTISCGKPTEKLPIKEPPENTVDIKDYSIIYAEDADVAVTERAQKLSSAIEDVMGISLPLTTDVSAEKAIIIGNTSRAETADAKAKLESEAFEDAFAIDITDNAIAIIGKTDLSTTRAVEYFISSYVEQSETATYLNFAAGKSVTKPFSIVSTHKLENGTEIDVELVTNVFEIPKGRYTEAYGYQTTVFTAHFPTVIELQHNGENNGKLLAIFCLNEYAYTPNIPNTAGCVMESSDGGETWKIIARPEETIDTSIKGISMAHLYELPAQVGDMPAGTLLYSGNSVNYSRKSHIAVWRSFDCGYTWEEYVIIAEGGGTKEGVWEPFMWYEESDGYLYCFYSDDSDPKHDQKLVYKRSKDGVNWSEVCDVCTFDTQSDRPGMFVMTSMGPGRYFMVYEYYGSKSGAVYYKVTGDVSSWDPKNPGKQLITSDKSYSVIGAPSCIWTPVGGRDGLLIAIGKKDADETQEHRLFVSLNNGSTWTTIENPLPYDVKNDAAGNDRVGHRASFFVSADGSTVYYINNTDNPETGLHRIQFARLKIYE
ncbi:MAG: exo-alpha-sialidase [Clostridia bacterium]|nr:exo-alpha-sialidase [Clostridia bacterium]